MPAMAFAGMWLLPQTAEAARPERPRCGRRPKLDRYRRSETCVSCGLGRTVRFSAVVCGRAQSERMSQAIDKNGQDQPCSHLNTDELALWQALKKISATTASVMRGEISPGVSGADFSVLSRIEELGDQRQILAQSDLMKSLGWDKSRLSHQLTRMQERGLIKRRRNGREAEVVMQQEGSRLLASARPKQVAIVQNYLSQLTQAEAKALKALAAKL